MKIYFSCSITGGRDEESTYKFIVDHLQSTGHEVLTAHLSSNAVLAEEKGANAEEIYSRDVNWLNECDVLIAEVSTPSHGVGFEIAYAIERNKAVLCLYQYGKTVSKMLLGNTSADMYYVSQYEDDSDLSMILNKFLGDTVGIM